MPVRDDILAKAFVYLDEVHPSQDEVNASAFPCEQFLDESGKWVARNVPLHSLGVGKELCRDGLKTNADGSGSLPLPSDFIRIIRFKMKDWLRPAGKIIYDDSPLYAQQFNPILRGGISKPVVAICQGETLLEYYSSPSRHRAQIEDARYFGFDKLDDDYPVNLHDIVAWRVAEMVAEVMGDAPTAQVCQNKIQEYMAAL
jgi:hypothetical protein